MTRSLTQTIAALRTGRISARNLLEFHLKRIERFNSLLNAFVYVDPRAWEAADASDARLRAGQPLSPLDGVPVAIKDNLLVESWPAVWGSPLFRKFVADHDEAPVARLRASGAVLLGKTNTPEFSLRGVTDSPVFGSTRNPWNVGLSPGGSSGGAVAAVAADLAPLALATDGGGSIRRPAAHTGLVGLKPGGGRIARAGGFPPLLVDCEVVGPIGRSVADVRLMFDVLATRRPVPAFPDRARILVVEGIGDAPVDPGLALRCREAAEAFAALGHEVRRGELPFSIETPMETWRTLMGVGLAGLVRAHPDFLEVAAPDFVEQALNGAGLSAVDHAALVETLFDFRALTAAVFEDVDVILTPTTAAQPWPVGESHPALIDGRPAGPRGHAIFTGWVNACGHPAISIPVRPYDDGMPVGVQLVGAMGADEWLMDLAGAFEATHPFADRRPEMAQ